MADSVVPFKIYLLLNDSDEPEIRRFSLPANRANSYSTFTGTVMTLFPSVANKEFKIYWQDDEGDKVYVSSEEEYILALGCMNSGAKKFYLKMQSPGQDLADEENLVLHPGIYCDGCERSILGFRYKCLMCRDYDLCKACEQAEIHPEHAMLKIPHPACLDRLNLRKLTEFVASSVSMKATSHRRRRSHEGRSDSHRKKKCEKREAGHDLGDEMDEGGHKHSHKKCRKPSGRPLPRCVIDYFNPVHFESTHSFCPPKKTQEAGHLTYLRTIATTIQKLLDPLGVNVEFEVRPKGENGGEAKKEEETSTSRPSPSAPPKETRFASPQEMAEAVKQGIEEITKTLANQTMSNENFSDYDGWVSYEELKRDSEESQANGNVESNPKGTQQEGSATQTESPAPETSSEVRQPEKLYPDLTPQELSSRVEESLQRMLAMGFTNEGNWLAYLLAANQGNLEQTLEALDPSKKNN